MLAVHSLSKRSNLPGLRSGFAAGGPRALAEMKKLRAYAGAPLPLPIQHVAEATWRDEAHVDASRALYQEKYAIADRILSGVQGYQPPEAGFFLWLAVEDGAIELRVDDRGAHTAQPVSPIVHDFLVFHGAGCYLCLADQCSCKQ